MNHKRLHYFFNIKIIISNRPLLPIVKRFYDLMNFLVRDFIVNQNLCFNIHESWIMTCKYSSSTFSERKKSNEIYDKLSDHFACIRTYCAGTIFEKTNCWQFILIHFWKTPLERFPLDQLSSNDWSFRFVYGLFERQIIEMCDIFYLDKPFFEKIVKVSPDPNLEQNRKSRKSWDQDSPVPGHLVKVSGVFQNRKARFSNNWLRVESSPWAVKT